MEIKIQMTLFVLDQRKNRQRLENYHQLGFKNETLFTC